MDLVEMGLFPAALVEDCPADGVCAEMRNDV